MKPTLLIDTDTVCYKFACGAEQTFNWGDGNISSLANLPLAISRMEKFEAEMMELFDTDQLIYCLSDPDRKYWRHDIWPTYKGSRVGSPPMTLKGLKQHVADTRKTIGRPRLEADDVMGVLATHPTMIPGEKIILSPDKDMRQIPGRLYNYETCIDRVITLEEADRWHMLQTLIGDRVDEYPGCPGIGERKAERIVPEGMDMASAWKVIVAAYQKSGQPEKQALVQARVSRILRWSDWNKEKKCPILWNPPPDSTKSKTPAPVRRSAAAASATRKKGKDATT